MRRITPRIWNRFIRTPVHAIELPLHGRLQERIRQTRVVLAVDFCRRLAEGADIWEEVLRGRGAEFDPASFVAVAVRRGSVGYSCLQVLVAQAEVEAERAAKEND